MASSASIRRAPSSSSVRASTISPRARAGSAASKIAPGTPAPARRATPGPAPLSPPARRAAPARARARAGDERRDDERRRDDRQAMPARRTSWRDRGRCRVARAPAGRRGSGASRRRKRRSRRTAAPVRAPALSPRSSRDRRPGARAARALDAGFGVHPARGGVERVSRSTSCGQAERARSRSRVRQPAGEQLVEHDAERVDVGRGRHRHAEDLFRRGIGRGQRAGSSRRVDSPVSSSEARIFAIPKSSSFTVARGVDQQVRGLEVAMHDEVAMGEIDRFARRQSAGARACRRSARSFRHQSTIGSPATRSRTR